MRKTNVVLSFDDGRKDSFYIAMEELLPRDLNATFNITSGYIEKNIPLDDMCLNEPMSVDEVVELSSYSLFEVAGHGYAHLNNIDDWKKGVAKLNEWLGQDYFSNGLGVASPHSVIDDNWGVENRYRCEELNIKYIRTGLSNQKNIIQRLISKIARETNNNFLMYMPVKESMKKIKTTDYLCYSIPILHQHSYDQVRFLVDKAIYHNVDIIFMLHSVLRNNEIYYDDMFSWDYENFVAFCDYLAEKKNDGLIEVKKNIDLFQRG